MVVRIGEGSGWTSAPPAQENLLQRRLLHFATQLKIMC